MTKSLDISEASFIMSRGFSGLMNGAFYSNLEWLGVLGGATAVVLTFLSFKRKRFSKWWVKWLYWGAIVASLASVLLVILSFKMVAPWLDIHLWTLATQCFQSFAMFVEEPSNWWRLLLMVSPAVFLQKLGVNLAGGNKWNYQGTDVASGAYYSVVGVKVPRLLAGNMYARLLLAIACTTILILKKKK